jgi:hypothetical protein
MTRLLVTNFALFSPFLIDLNFNYTVVGQLLSRTNSYTAFKLGVVPIPWSFSIALNALQFEVVPVERALIYVRATDTAGYRHVPA